MHNTTAAPPTFLFHGSTPSGRPTIQQTGTDDEEGPAAAAAPMEEHDVGTVTPQQQAQQPQQAQPEEGVAVGEKRTVKQQLTDQLNKPRLAPEQGVPHCKELQAALLKALADQVAAIGDEGALMTDNEVQFVKQCINRGMPWPSYMPLSDVAERGTRRTGVRPNGEDWCTAYLTCPPMFHTAISALHQGGATWGEGEEVKWLYTWPGPMSLQPHLPPDCEDIATPQCIPVWKHWPMMKGHRTIACGKYKCAWDMGYGR